MKRIKAAVLIVLVGVLGFSLPGAGLAAEESPLEEIQRLKERIAEIEMQLEAQQVKSTEASKASIEVGGALRFNYRYDDDNRFHERSKDKGVI